MSNIFYFGERPDEGTLAQAEDVRSRALHMALMADNHLGYIMPIGGVAAYKNQVSVAGVGFDIGCGNCAVKTDKHVDDVDFATLADEIAARFSFGVGRTESDGPDVNHILLHSAWDGVPKPYRSDLQAKAGHQAGTIGSGNHYIDVFSDEEGWVWVGVHFGSRGFGHSIASGFMAIGKGADWAKRGAEAETLLDLKSELGKSYWGLMNLAGEYAFVCREWAAEKTADMFGGNIVDSIHNNHNFAWKETHLIDGVFQEVVVIRKGATPAFPQQRGFVGGSMGDNAVILSGAVTNDEEVLNMQSQSLWSTVHGAGRVMSRSKAKKNVTRQDVSDWMNPLGTIVRGGDVDESPQAYRRLEEVLFHQGETIEIEHVLTPKVVVMAGAKVHDPYKD